MEQGTEWLCTWWQWFYSFLILQWLNSLHSLFCVLYWLCCSAHIHKQKFYFLCSFPLNDRMNAVSSVHFRCSVVSNSLQSRGLHHARLLCPSPTTRACSNSCPSNSWPSSQWCHLSSMVSRWCHPSHPLLLLPSIFPSIRVFSNESVLCIRWPKYWSFSFSISPSNEYSGLISFRIEWLHLLAVQGTLKSSPTPQFKSINSWALSLLYGPTFTSICDYL